MKMLLYIANAASTPTEVVTRSPKISLGGGVTHLLSSCYKYKLFDFRTFGRRLDGWTFGWFDFLSAETFRVHCLLLTIQYISTKNTQLLATQYLSAKISVWSAQSYRCGMDVNTKSMGSVMLERLKRAGWSRWKKSDEVSAAIVYTTESQLFPRKCEVKLQEHLNNSAGKSRYFLKQRAVCFLRKALRVEGTKFSC